MITVYRLGNPVHQFKPDDRSIFAQSLMGENKVTANFTTFEKVDFITGDYIEYNNQKYYINNTPTETKVSSREFEYEIIFESVEYFLTYKVLQHEGVSDFDYFGDPMDFLLLLVENINKIDSGWSVGSVDEGERKTISFNDTSVRSALTQVASEYEFEYFIEGKSISLKKVIGSKIEGFSLKYGMNKGLYSLSRRPFDEAGVITRLYAYGAAINIPADYRGGIRRLVMSSRYIDRNVDIYGVRESSVTFEDIYPRRNAAATGVGEDGLSIYDTTLDFDLNEVIVDGQAQIVFTTGYLEGNSFDIASYNNTTKRIYFKPNKEESGYTLPNDNVKPVTGDKYVLTGIIMPQSYITAAEQELFQRATEYAQDNLGVVKVVYDLNADPLFLKRNPEIYAAIKPGNLIYIEDEDLNVNEAIRVQAISFPLSDPTRITATISDEVVYTNGERILKEIKRQSEEIVSESKRSVRNGRTQAILREELRNSIFDPDGYFDAENIKPLSIETGMLTVGARGQDFSLTITFNPNYNEDRNSISWTSGSLDHFTVDPLAIRTWEISSGSITVPNDSAYYIYAKSNKLGNTASISVTTEKIKTEGTSEDYYFLIGVLSSPIDVSPEIRIRYVSLTYGATTINGRFITTGTIDADRINASEIIVRGGGLFEETIIEAGYIKTNLIDVEELFAQTISVGEGGFANAGISGVTDNGNSSVRFWAGATAENKESAPFLVRNDGSLKAFKGRIGGFNIDEAALYLGSTTVQESNVYFSPTTLHYRTDTSSGGPTVEYDKQIHIDVRRSSQLAQQIRTESVNNQPGVRRPNIALDLSAFGSPNPIDDVGLQVRGNVMIYNGNTYVRGRTYIQNIGGGFGMQFVNGWYVDTVPFGG